MQPPGFRPSLRQGAPSRSAHIHAALPLRPLMFLPGRLAVVSAASGLLDGGASQQPGRGPAARQPGSQESSPSGSPDGDAGKAPATPVLAAVDTDVSALTSTSATSGGASEPSSQMAADPASPAPQLQGQAPAGSSAVSAASPASADTATAAGGGSAAGTVPSTSTTTTTTTTTSSSSSSSSPLPPIVQQLLAWLSSVWSAVQQFPLWVQMQHLKRLREACEEDPQDADKHAAYLSELVRTNPREVLARMESRQFGVNSAVVAEYLRALLASGRVNELVKADGAAATATTSAVAVAAVPELPPPRTLAELLQDLQDQLAAASAGDGAAGDAAGGGGSSLEVPGSSQRRPLHVVVGGLPPFQPMASGPQQLPHRTPLLLRPLALLWRLTSAAVLFLVLAFAYIAGSQAIRRVQASGGAFVNPAAVGAGPPVTAAGGGSGSGAPAASSSSSSGGGPSVEPKEYKKDELPEKSIRTFKDVKGCDEAKEELREVVEFLKNPTKFTRLGAKLPKGVLLTGPPGTGKTLLAKAVAGEAGVPFFYRAGSEFEELYVGVGSRRMRALFAAAKKRSPCIVFIDEIDAIGGNRKAWENHTRKTLNQLLVEMDGFESTDGIIVMAATNLPESLDPALKRPGRFDRQVAVPLPDIKGRRDILEYYLSDKPLAGDVDRELLARQTQGFSGADLSNLINEGAILAAKEGSETISQRMLDWAYDKILMGVERKSVKRTLEARRRTAFHEAGHALVALATPGASPIHKATIVPRGHALGMVMQLGREDEFSINRQQMLARIRVCMGGTVAEELVFGEDQVSSGATDDLRQATSMARHMVTECGMSAAIGPVYVAAIDERHGGSGVSEATRQRVDGEVAAMLGEAKEAVRALLSERMQDLCTLAEALLDRETLTREEINSLLQHGDQQTPPPQAPGGGGGSGGGGGGGRRHRDGDEQLEGDPTPAAAQVAPQAGSAPVTASTLAVAAAAPVAAPALAAPPGVAGPLQRRCAGDASGPGGESAVLHRAGEAGPGARATAEASSPSSSPLAGSLSSRGWGSAESSADNAAERWWQGARRRRGGEGAEMSGRGAAAAGARGPARGYGDADDDDDAAAWCSDSGSGEGEGAVRPQARVDGGQGGHKLLLLRTPTGRTGGGWGSHAGGGEGGASSD